MLVRIVILKRHKKTLKKYYSLELISVQLFFEKLKALDSEQKVKDLFENFSQSEKLVVIPEQLFAIPLSYSTKDESECLWEAHRVYYDVHIMVNGTEQVFVNNLNQMNATSDYERTNDYQLFEGEAEHKIELNQQFCLVLSPNDVHKTGVRIGEYKKLNKLVLKVEKSLITDVG